MENYFKMITYIWNSKKAYNGRHFQSGHFWATSGWKFEKVARQV